MEKRIVGIENVVEEEEYKPQLLGTNKTPLQSDHSEKIHIQKSRKKRKA
jgi:hypothetical protein